MSFKSRASAVWSALTSRSQPPGGFSSGTSLIGGPLTIDAFGTQRAPTPYQLVESYKSLIYACVQINMNAVTRVPLRLYANTSKGKRASDASKPRSISRGSFSHLRSLPYARSIGPSIDDVQEITDHPLIDVLDAPAVVEDENGEVSYFTREEFISLISIYCDVVGSHYVFPMGAKGRPPKYLWPLFSQYVLPVPASSSPAIGSYQYFADTYKPSQLLRFRSTSLSIRDPYKAGYSPTYAALCYAQLEDTFVAIQEQVLAAGPRPNLVFSSKDPMMPVGEPERRRFDMDLQRTQSRGNAGKHLVTNGAWDIKPLSYSPTDLAGLDLSKYDMQRTANCFGTPIPYLEGDTDAMNLKGADVQHARNTIEPRHRMIAGTLTRLARQYDPRLFFAFDPALPEDEEMKAKVYDMKINNGSITINQANEDTLYPPVPWGDEPWIASSLAQPSMVQEKHQMGLTAQASEVENKAKATEFQFGDDPDAAENAEMTAESDAESETEESRLLDERITRVLGEIESELRWKDKGNPYHDDDGKFTGPGGHTGRKPKEPNKGREKGKADIKAGDKSGSAKASSGKSGGSKDSGKTSKDSGKTAGHTGSGGGKVAGAAGGPAKGKDGLTDRERKGKPEVLSEKALRAQQNQSKTDGTVQVYTKNMEFELAKRVGGKAFPDNDPADVHVDLGGGKVRAVEVKTITHGKNDKITMKGSALDRKVDLEKKLGTQMDVVALDHRDRFDGGKNKSLHSGHEIYYKRGLGSLRIGSMYKCKNDAELKKLMRTPYDELPDAAKGKIRGTKS